MLRHIIFVVSVAWAAFSCIGWTFVFPSNMLSDDLHFVPLSLSPMIKKTPGDAVMLRLIYCPLNQFIDVEFYAQRNSQDTTSHQNEAKYKFCHVWSGRPGENGQWHRTSQFFLFFTFTFDNFKRVQIQKRRVLVPPEKPHQNDCSAICCILLHNHCSCLCYQTAGNEVQSYSSSVAIHQHNSVAVNSGSSYGGLDQWMAVGLFESLHHCLLFSFFYLKWPHLLLFDGVNITRTLKPKKKMVRTG